VLLLAGFAYASYRSVDLVAGASALKVSRIAVRGNERLSTGEVLTVLDGLRGQNILAADLTEWQRRLKLSPWVADAALRRILPSTIEVLVAERAPMAIGRVGNQLYLVDARGEIIDDFGPNYAEFDLPIIDGLSSLGSGPAADTDEARARLAGDLLESLGQRKDVLRRISQIDVHDAQNAVVLLDGDPASIHIGAEKFLERLQTYVELAPTLRQRVPEIDYVDLRFDNRVYVRPVDRAGPPAGTGSSSVDTEPMHF
jgi:cell division protein FtsQ